MDPTSFTALLNSETEIPLTYDFQSSQYVSIDSNVDDTYVEDLTVEGTPSDNKKVSRLRLGNFTNDEDKLLVSAWLNVSLDPVKGSEQKKNQYWTRIADYFEKNKKWVGGRSNKSLNSRWMAISKSVSKFCGYHAQIDSFRRSGYTEQDKVVEAKEMYKKEEEGRTFVLDHCWNLMRFQQKWIDECQRLNIKRRPKPRKNASPSTMTTDSIDLEDDSVEGPEPAPLKRPIGRKAAKKAIQMAKGKEQVTDVTDNANEVLKKVKTTGNEDVPSKTLSELDIFRARKLESDRIRAQQMDLLIETEQRQVALREKEIEIQSRSEDVKIMAKDTSVMPPLQAQYFISLQQEILARRATAGENQ